MFVRDALFTETLTYRPRGLQSNSLLSIYIYIVYPIVKSKTATRSIGVDMSTGSNIITIMVSIL
jgi:hypothetical protein